MALAPAPSPLVPPTLADAISVATLNLASLTQAACLISASETFLYVNEAYCRKTDRRPEDVIGKALADVIDPGAYDIVRPNVEKALKTRQMVRFSRPWQDPDGTQHWVEFHYMPQFSEDGNIWGFQAIAYDRHDLTQEESDALERERLLRNLSDLSGSPMFYIDRQLIIQYANKPCLEWIEKSYDDIVGEEAITVFNKQASDFYLPLVNRALGGETIHMEAPSTSRARGTHRIKISVIPDLRTNGDITGVFISALDIEEDYQLRQALQNRERQLRLFTDNIPEAVAYLDTERRYKFVNKAFLAQRGLQTDSVIGKTTAEILGADAYNFAKPYAERALKGETVSYERLVKTAAGEDRWHRVRTVPDFSADGTVQGIYAVGIDIHDVKQAQDALAKEEAELRDAIDSLPYPMAYLDRTLRYQFVNKSFLAITGLTREQIINRDPKEFFGQKALADAEPYWQRALNGETVASERLIAYGNSEPRWMIVKYTPRLNAQGEVIGFYSASTDIDELKRTELALRRANWLLTSHFENTPLAVIEWDTSFHVRRWSPQAEKIFGWSEADVIGKKLTNWRFVFDEDRELVSGIADRLRQQKDPRATSLNRNYRKDGRVIWVEWYNSSLMDDKGNVISVFSLAQDVTTRILAEERLVHQATHDGLTGLPNRIMLQERLRQAITRARRTGTRVAGLFIDLDRFKDVNDTLGHRVGDELLRETARRLQTAIRESDLLVRLSGDEFMVVVEQVTELDAPTIVGNKLLAEIRAPFHIDGNEIYVACSIGISLFPDDAEDAETLLKNADMAMYRAKEFGKNNCQSFTKDMYEQSTEMRMLENALRTGISKRELSLRFQPKVSIETNQIIGTEALVRWHHPTRGEIMPSDFIHIAEESGLIHDIGFWVLEQTLKTIKQWAAQGINTVPVAVNLSAGQFRVPHFAERIINMVQHHEVSPSLLEFEITETGLIRDPEGVGETLYALRRAGMRVAIDDFGTGYSSLSHLKRFPIDCIKIDRSFVADLLVDTDDRAIVSAVIALALALQIDVVAEGVEHEMQRELLEGLGCHAYQGYLFAKPLTSDDFVARLKQHQKMPQ
jgi:diguanylate cyclase (GGDEF)-like protein/PAS domain S-box-containing protein